MTPFPDPTNVTDAIAELAGAARSIGTAILPSATGPGHDAAGGTVQSLTEAVMGITAGLYAVSASIENLAEAVRESNQ